MRLREIAGDAAAVLVRKSRAGSGRAAARDTARVALAPIIAELRSSSFALLDRMLPTVPLRVVGTHTVVGDPAPSLSSA